MPPSRRPRTAFPFMLLAIGIGLSAYYGWQWTRLPTYSDADLDASVELNAQLELQAHQAQATPEGLSRLRAQTRQDLLADIARERHEVETGLSAGLIALVAGLGHLLLVTLLNRARS
ncbi:MAG: hypothetical protein QM661_14520 [Solimonas sp.]